MTQADDRSSEHDDEMLPEYDLSKLGRGVRGKHAEAMRQGYSVTVHHDDGTSTIRYVPSSTVTHTNDVDCPSSHCDPLHSLDRCGHD